MEENNNLNGKLINIFNKLLIRILNNNNYVKNVNVLQILNKTRMILCNADVDKIVLIC